MRVPEGPTKSALSVFLSAHSLSVPNGVRVPNGVKGNYGLQFSCRDRWRGTFHPDYEKCFGEVISR
jgi:hypothetical protein